MIVRHFVSLFLPCTREDKARRYYVKTGQMHRRNGVFVSFVKFEVGFVKVRESSGEQHYVYFS